MTVARNCFIIVCLMFLIAIMAVAFCTLFVLASVFSGRFIKQALLHSLRKVHRTVKRVYILSNSLDYNNVRNNFFLDKHGPALS
jgi:sensor domain CHASE-containing protein